MSLLLLVQFVVYALAWFAGSLMLQDDRRPARLWAGYCAMQALGVWVHRAADQPDGPVVPPAAMLMALAYGLAAAGIDGFVHRRVRHWPLWIALVVVVDGALALLWAQRAPSLPLVVTYNLGIVAFLALPLALTWRPFIAEFGRLGGLAMLPGLLMALATLVRVASVLADPSRLQQDGGLNDNEVRAMVALAAAGTFNFALVSMIVGRLVIELGVRIETDPLTGLANRSGLQRRLRQAWRGAHRHRQPLSVAFIDVDRLKQVNDSAGHEAGDRLIQAVAEALRHRARASDVVGRWGGDEFMVVMPQTGADGAALAVHGLRESIAGTAVALPGGLRALSVSVGMATLQPGDADVDALVARADAEMYRVKGLRRAA